METIGLRELNQNPSKAVARVRAGASILVTDRGKPVLRMVPETEQPGILRRMIESGDVAPPAEQGMADLIPDLAPELPSLSDVLVDERRKERER
ncbi:type II toxin-antitoxin system Phd/YefM family antitoxin [Streptomyces sp. KLOTTS4A1]|uniref:type II toxin-antitoxin system Phd/YefM family antitoxin n=1 Tax=Streptomyces sp. KLOTTS4A1 TaxID=3390996 RepID=UPI0039F5570B